MQIVETPISADELRRILDYDPLTGIFTWKVKTSRKVVVGTRAGSYRNGGYGRINIAGRQYTMQWLAWLHYYGRPPKDLVDHRDHCGGNNRIANLRECTHAQNMHNTRRSKRNKSGAKGVRFRSDFDRWVAYIKAPNRKTKHLGLFDSFDMAAEFRQLACDLLHGDFACHA